MSDGTPPQNDEILEHFWNDTFLDLHGFDFLRLMSETAQGPRKTP